MGNPLTEQIAEIIERMLKESGGELELQRNKLANTVGCVPSQINYVITSRFNTNRGYIVESKRGGGGYVKITKVNFDNSAAMLMHSLAAVGESIDAQSAKAILISLYDADIITERELKLIYSVINDRALSLSDANYRDALRADIIKSFILALRNYNY